VAGHGRVRLGLAGVARRGLACPGQPGRVAAKRARSVGVGPTRPVKARQARQGRGHDEAGRGRRGSARRAQAWLGETGRQGWEWLVLAQRGVFAMGRGRHGVASLDEGMMRLGMAGKAGLAMNGRALLRQGKAGKARPGKSRWGAAW